MEAAIERDLQLRLPRWLRQRSRAPEVHGLVARAIAGPLVATELHRISPVLAVRFEPEHERLAGGAAGLLGDRRPWPCERGAVRSALEIRAPHHGQLREIVGAAN